MYRIWYKTTLAPPVKLLTHTEVISVFLVGWYHLWARAVPAIILSSSASDPVLRCSAQCHSSYRVTLCVGVSQGWLGKADRLALTHCSCNSQSGQQDHQGNYDPQSVAPALPLAKCFTSQPQEKHKHNPLTPEWVNKCWQRGNTE